MKSRLPPTCKPNGELQIKRSLILNDEGLLMADSGRRVGDRVTSSFFGKVQSGDTWLAIEITRASSQSSWKLEITTEEMKTITWPVPFETSDRALQVAMQTIDQIGASNMAAFARPEIPQKH
ncbi:hypothetical protein [Sulfitobacter sp. SK011]|uniref:hypothetical protein n=1 Tax=Sulfitobacter sp. SK011 TaxID=1389004 RepID=UPI0013B46F1A|nr:hypothetical protein [Sulfitobacter sp. SK011]